MLMIRRLITGALAALLVTGCSDSRKPTVRGGTTESDAPSTDMTPPADVFPSSPHGEGPPGDLGPEVRLGAVQLTAPESWIRKAPRSGFVLAEFGLPQAEGDTTEGRLTVTAVGGSIEANVARWRDQFGGKPDQESQEEIEVSGVPVTLIDLAGAYDEQHMGMGPTEHLPGYRMQAAIFSAGGQQFIIKGYGPEKTMAAHADEFLALIRSLKSPHSGPSEPEVTPPEAESTTPEAAAPEG